MTVCNNKNWKENPFLKLCPACEDKGRDEEGLNGCVPCQEHGMVLDESKFWFTKWTQEQHHRSEQSVKTVKASDEQWLGMQYDMDDCRSTIYEIRIHEKRIVYTVEQVTELLGFLGHTPRPSCSCSHDCCGCVSSSIRLWSHDPRPYGRYWLFREDFSMNI